MYQHDLQIEEAIEEAIETLRIAVSCASETYFLSCSEVFEEEVIEEEDFDGTPVFCKQLIPKKLDDGDPKLKKTWNRLAVLLSEVEAIAKL